MDIAEIEFDEEAYRAKVQAPPELEDTGTLPNQTQEIE